MIRNRYWIALLATAGVTGWSLTLAPVPSSVRTAPAADAGQAGARNPTPANAPAPGPATVEADAGALHSPDIFSGPLSDPALKPPAAAALAPTPAAVSMPPPPAPPAPVPPPAPQVPALPQWLGRMHTPDGRWLAVLADGPEIATVTPGMVTRSGYKVDSITAQRLSLLQPGSGQRVELTLSEPAP